MKPDQRKRQDSTDNLEKICRTLLDVFTVGGPIKHVVISFGATVMSPKELYILNFPTAVYEGPVLSYNSCRSILFRKLVTCDFFADAKPLRSLAKLSVLVYALRSCNLCAQNLHPKTSYKIPLRGQRLVVDLDCQSPETNANLTKVDEAYLDISGVEPLAPETPAAPTARSTSTSERLVRLSRSVPRDFDCYMSTPLTQNRPDFNAVCDQMMDLELEQSCPKRVRTCSIGCLEELDYIWYQVPFTMKGYREKNVKQAATADLWA